MTAQELLARLIGFDTTSPRSNLALLSFVQDYLQGHGVASWLVHDDSGEKANLFATIGPDNGRGIIFSGHTDTVPVDGQDWSHDPFDMVERNGRLHGRGTCDMKGFLACALAAVPHAVAAPLQRPIHLAFSHDEEIGCIGVRSLLDALKARDFAAELCLVGEPTAMQVVTGHKGKITVEVEVLGKAAHSSLTPEGVNAIEHAARAILKVREIAERHRRHGPFDESFDVPHTTGQVGVVAGGNASNIVPAHASFVFEFRALPQDDLDALMGEVHDHLFRELQPAMQAEAPEARIVWHELSRIPALDTPADAPATRLVQRLVGRNDHARVAFGTEGGLFQQRLDIPTIVCGPGDIAQAHKADEYVESAQLEQCQRLLHRLIDHACS